MPNLQDMIQRLTDVYTKNPDSKLGKLMAIFQTQLQQVEDTLKKVEDWRNIDKAEGTTLDMIGQSVVQPRGQATDEIYRVLIKSKIARNLSKTDVNTIITVLTTALDTLPEEITIEERWSHPTDPEPAALHLSAIPISRLNEVGMAPATFARIVQRTVAAGVDVGVIELAGTFEFATGLEYETDPAAGFGDLDGTEGGSLGLSFVPATDQNLPI